MTTNTNMNHRTAIDGLGLVHEHRCVSDPLSGQTFVLKADYGKTNTRIRITVTGLMTTVQGFNENGKETWSFGFSANTPGRVIAQAVQAAIVTVS